MDEENLIKELKEHLQKLEAVTEFHILSAAKFIEEKYKIQKRIQEITENETDSLRS